MIFVWLVTSFSCYITPETEGEDISWGNCDLGVKHCYFRNSSGGEITRACALDSDIEYFKNHSIQEQGCMICEEHGGFNMSEGREPLEIDDLVCICNTNYCNGFCTGKDCKENEANNERTESHCDSDCKSTWKVVRSHGELMYHSGYIWYLQAITCVIMHKMKKLCWFQILQSTASLYVF